MGKHRRTLWISLIIIGLFGPFAALFVLIELYPPPTGSAAAPPAQRSDVSDSPLFDATAPAVHPGPGPLLAAGDGHEIWVARPLTIGDHNVAAFELLMRANNSGRWSPVRPGGAAFFQSTPLAIAAPFVPDGTSRGVFVFGGDGRVTAFNTDVRRDIDALPAGQQLLAATGSATGLFAVTAGVMHKEPARRERAPLLPPYPLRAPSGESASQPASSPASQAAATATTAPATAPERSTVNVFWFHAGGWTALPALGAVGDADIPAGGPHVAVLDLAGSQVVLWIPQDDPSRVLLRTRSGAKPEEPWGTVRRVALAQPVPTQAPLLSFVLNGAPCIVYAVPAGRTYALVAQRIALTHEPSASAPSSGIQPMFLGSAGENVASPSQITVALSENSLVAITTARDGSLHTAVFGRDGKPLTPPATVNLSPSPTDVQIGQNVAMLLVALLVVMALWAWIKDPRTQRMPKGLRPGSLPARALAFAIDLGIPFVIVVTAMGMWEDGSYQNIFSAWGASLTHPEELFSSLPLLYILGGYTLHVAVGELFFRRSIGKAVAGLEVLMIDGKAPTVAAVLVRNLVRLAEMVPAGILIFFLFVSDYRQRLGDLLAHTVVVSHKSPGDDDSEETTEKSSDVEDEEPAARR